MVHLILRVHAEIVIEVRELDEWRGVHRDLVRHAIVEAVVVRRIEVHDEILLPADVVGHAHLVAVRAGDVRHRHAKRRIVALVSQIRDRRRVVRDAERLILHADQVLRDGVGVVRDDLLDGRRRHPATRTGACASC